MLERFLITLDNNQHANAERNVFSPSLVLSLVSISSSD